MLMLNLCWIKRAITKLRNQNSVRLTGLLSLSVPSRARLPGAQSSKNVFLIYSNDNKKEIVRCLITLSKTYICSKENYRCSFRLKVDDFDRYSFWQIKMLESSVNIDAVRDILQYVVSVNDTKSCIIHDTLVNIISTWPSWVPSGQGFPYVHKLFVINAYQERNH